MRRSAWLAWGAIGIVVGAIAACATGGSTSDDSSKTDSGGPGQGDATTTKPGDGGTTKDGGDAASTCNSPMQICGDAGCVDTTTDQDHCGNCTTACMTGDAGALVSGSNDNPDAGIPNLVIEAGAPWSVGTASCAKSACGVDCPSGLTLCSDNVCYDTLNFHEHCGDCNTACASGEYCAGGHCCASGSEYCNGACTDVLSNDSNCGGCGVTCTGSQSCSGGQCINCGATNEALTATPTTSSGGVSPYGPTNANDGILETNSCTYYSWLETGEGSTTEWIQYKWAAAHTLTKIHVDTTAVTNDSCGLGSYSVLGAEIQWWNGASWVTDGTVSNETNDWDYTFTAAVTTTEVRLYSVRSASGFNAFIYEWQVFGCN